MNYKLLEYYIFGNLIVTKWLLYLFFFLLVEM